MKKKPYIFKKSEADMKSDPMVNFHRAEDDRNHNRSIRLTKGKKQGAMRQFDNSNAPPAPPDPPSAKIKR